MKSGEYVGWHNYTNYGDDILYQIIVRMGLADDPESGNVIFGGGTILPLNDKLKDTIKTKDVKNIVCFGTGISSKDFYGTGDFDADMKATREYLCDAKMGFRSKAEQERIGLGNVIGDPFFSIDSPTMDKRENLVIMNVGQSHGNCWGGLEAEMNTFLQMCKFGKELQDSGKELLVVPLWEADKTLAITASKYIGCGYMNKIPTLNEMLRLMGAAEAVITWKLHAMITALTVNTPVLAIEYHQKIKDVADDFGVDTLRTDKVTIAKLRERWDDLKHWDYVKVKAQKEKFALATFKFLNYVKDGEKDD